jgi:Hypoxia induced protein conserved region
MRSMSSLFAFLMVIAMLAVLGALGLGLFGMVRGGDFNARYGNRLMWWRVRLQCIALVLFVLAVLAGGT